MLSNQNLTNSKKPSDRDFISMLVKMATSESAELTICFDEKNNNQITTNDLTSQIHLALRDVFVANINKEENNVLRLEFPNNEKFKLRIIKE
ncbi:MAG: hypothetical protein FWE22_07860 [Firmicutes bacterium]|nr:hypothetical protein [Bacillota bacterium]